MKSFIFIVTLIVYSSCIFAFDGYHRYRNYDVLHYEFALKLNDSTDVIEGKTIIDLRIREKTDTILLDLAGVDEKGKGMTVTFVAAGKKEVAWKQSQSKLLAFPGRSLWTNDTLSITVIYHGIPKDGLIISRNKFGDRTFFADHWPDRAHNYLPCIDHPYDKATVDFVITAPDKYSVVANGLLIEQSSLEKNQKLTRWSEKLPLPVKVMAFGVARFATEFAGDPENVPVWTWVYPQNRAEGFHDYAIAVKPLSYYSNLLGKYPFEKLANVQSKTIYGGLENAGAIFYYENSVNGSGNDEGLMAHEIAHQWFGDCVTEADWHHIWLSEGFATYLTSMYLESVYGATKLAEDMTRTREMVLRFYSRHQAPVIDTTVTNLMELLSINSYQKGGWVLHMLRSEIGDENFKKGLSLFFSGYKNSNVLTSDFQHVMEEVSGKELDLFFMQWLRKAGQPELKVQFKNNGSSGEITIEQIQKDLFDFQLEILVTDSAGEHREKIHVHDRVTHPDLHYRNITALKADPNVRLLYKLVE